MTKRLVIIMAVLLVAIFAVTAVAQQQGGGGQFSAMREKYKYTFQLMQMVRHIGDIDKDKKYTLTPAQAKSVLGVLKPWRSKPKMTQDQAKGISKSLKKVFTADQLNAMARIKSHFGQGPGGRGPGAGQGGPRPGGPNGQGGQRHFDPNAMKDFNPFYTKVAKGDDRAAQRAKRMNEFFAELEAKVKGRK
jgi:hypothetical protein